MLEKEIVLPKEALALKSIGFDEFCFYYYVDNKLIKNLLDISNKDCDSVDNQCLAPTYSQAFRWFRDKHKLHATITSISQESWQWHIQEPGQKLGELYNEDYYYYEEAELECLKELIEIVKNK
jgi:hypothetical protein